MHALPAPASARLLACLCYEALVVSTLLLIGFLLPQAALAGAGVQLGPRWLWLHLGLTPLPYFVWCWARGGQTLPMKTWRLQLQGLDGAPPRPMQAFLRYLAAWLSFALLGAGFLMAFADPLRRTLHDRIAGTRLVSLTAR